jgi:hypothetical protein
MTGTNQKMTTKSHTNAAKKPQRRQCVAIGYEGNQHSNPNKSAASLDDKEEDKPMDFAVPMDEEDQEEDQ